MKGKNSVFIFLDLVKKINMLRQLTCNRLLKLVKNTFLTTKEKIETTD